MPEAPPNLRYSTSDRDCSNCTAFKPNAQTCSMFSDYPVGPELVCNSWKRKSDATVSGDGEAS